MIELLKATNRKIYLKIYKVNINSTMKSKLLTKKIFLSLSRNNLVSFDNIF